jgi:DNA repair ATPase RecN
MGLTIANSVAIAGTIWYLTGRNCELEEDLCELRAQIRALETAQRSLKKRQAESDVAKNRLMEAEERIEELEKFVESLGDVEELSHVVENLDKLYCALESADIEYERVGKVSKSKKKWGLSKTKSKVTGSRHSTKESDEDDIYDVIEEDTKRKSKRK